MRQRLINLRRTIECYGNGIDVYSPVATKMLMLGLLSEMAEINVQLSEIQKDMSDKITEDDASIDVGIFCDFDQNLITSSSEDSYDESIQEALVNYIVQFFPLNKKKFDSAEQKASGFKNSMQFLASEKNLSERDLRHALKEAQSEIIKTLILIDHKKKELTEEQYEDFWFSFLLRDDDLYPEQALVDLNEWKESHESNSILALKDKRAQEMLALIKTGVFSHVPIVNRDRLNCSIKITEDNLDPGMELPQKIAEECARMSKFIIKKKDILYFDVANLGKYLYQNYNKISREQGDALIYFYYILDFIQNDMAELNPQLKPLVSSGDFEEDIDEEIEGIVSCCSGLFKPGVGIEIVLQYFKAAAKSDDIVIESLRRKSKRTKLVCQMIGMLMSTTKIFADSAGAMDIANALSAKIKKPQPNSLRSYIDKGKGDHKGKLHQWTSDYINKHFVTGTTSSVTMKK